jgi:cytochrome c-type biogenesis protein CcmH/NrfF
MRAQVTAMTSGGASAAEVRSWFVRRYGRGILLLPTSHGPDLALWMTPAVPAVLACGYLTWRQVTVRRSAGRSS